MVVFDRTIMQSGSARLLDSRNSTGRTADEVSESRILAALLPRLLVAQQPRESHRRAQIPRARLRSPAPPYRLNDGPT